MWLRLFKNNIKWEEMQIGIFKEGTTVNIEIPLSRSYSRIKSNCSCISLNEDKGDTIVGTIEVSEIPFFVEGDSIESFKTFDLTDEDGTTELFKISYIIERDEYTS